MSLFNFVPCCYSCNSKFKRDDDLVDVKDKNDSILSPSSTDFSFHKDNFFKIFYKANKPNLSNLKVEEDFAVRLVSDKHRERYSKYIEIFKLNARYKAHKADVLELIKKHQRYSKKKTQQIAELLKCDEKEVRADIFGSLLFTDDPIKNSKSKLMKDIAQNIKLE